MLPKFAPVAPSLLTKSTVTILRPQVRHRREDVRRLRQWLPLGGGRVHFGNKPRIVPCDDTNNCLILALIEHIKTADPLAKWTGRTLRCAIGKFLIRNEDKIIPGGTETWGDAQHNEFHNENMKKYVG